MRNAKIRDKLKEEHTLDEIEGCTVQYYKWYIILHRLQNKSFSQNNNTIINSIIILRKCFIV